MRYLRLFKILTAVCLTALLAGACGSRAEAGSIVLAAGVSPDGASDTGDADEAAGDEGTLSQASNGEGETQAEAVFVAEVPKKTIVVHVCGAVNREGVYTLDEGSRVYEAVAAAGGFSTDADEAYINQAETLSDGVRLRIPSLDETAALYAETEGVETARAQADIEVITGSVSADPQSESGMGGRININTADAQTLCKLNGVGPATAAKIIAYREANGGFKAIEDIMLVSGIKDKLFAKIKDDITV